MHVLAAKLACLGLVLSASGCATMYDDPYAPKDNLRDSQRLYTKLIRWGEVEKAARFVDPKLRDDFLDHIAAFREIRITDFEVGEIDVGEDETARVTVTYHGYSLALLLERPLREEQEWYHDEEAEQWRVRPKLAGMLETLRGTGH